MVVRRRIRTVAALLAVSTLTAVGGATGSRAADPIPGTAGAGTSTGVVEPPRPAFYEPPAAIPALAGTVIRSEPATFLLDPLHLSSTMVTATRVMYASRDVKGRPMAVTGTLFVPRAPWIGFGVRPLISYAPGTQGLADRCAPSRLLSDTVLEYEGPLISGFITRGYAILLTDYQGLGTPGSHTYMVRAPQGQAVLDGARAALRLQGLSASSTPIGIMGYSQGGGAAASAAELAASYAPELRVKGVVAGAVPAELAAVAANLDGGLFAAFGGYGMIGLAEAGDVDLTPYLNASGRDHARRLEGSCVTDLAEFAFKRSSDLSADGRSFSDYLREEPFKTLVAQNRIGRLRPAMPVRLVHSALDDTIPYAVGRQLMRDWCARGTNATFSTNIVPTHLGGMAPHIGESMAFFEARFAGLPQLSNCWFYG